MNRSPLLLGAFLLSSLGAAWAGPLQEAQVNQIINDVKIVDPQKGARPAAVRDTVRDQIAVRTGIQSRAELLFQDATLTRLGAETLFSFKAGTRDLSLERGTMLLQVPKNRGGARIRTASVTASITGTTIMIEHLPGSSLKVMVLEGSLRLSSNSRFGEAVNLKPGKMVIMKPNDTRIPNPVDVDIRKVMKSSALVDPALFAGKSSARVAALPSIPLIEKAIAEQDRQLARKELIATNLVIPGSGTNVVLASDETLAQIERSVAKAQATDETSPITRTNSGETTTTIPNSNSGAGSDLLASGSGTGGSSAGGTSGSASGGTTSGGTTSGGTTSGGTTGGGTSGGASGGTTGGTTPPTVDLIFASTVDQDTFSATGRLIASGDVGSRTISMGGAIDVDGELVARGGAAIDGSTYLIEGGSIRAGQGLCYNGAAGGQTVLGVLLNGPQAGGNLTLHANSIDFSGSGINGAQLNGGDAVQIGYGGDGGTLRIGTALQPIAGDVRIEAPIKASTGRSVGIFGTPPGGTGGTVSAVANGGIRVNSTVKVSDSGSVRPSYAGGTISLESTENSGSAIRIESSGQLLSLLSSTAPGPGGTIKLKATNGGIEVDGGTIRADRGTVEMKALDPTARIDLTNANIRGDTVKVGALGADGQLTIGGGTIHADSMLKLYGGSSNGSVRFKDNVTLGGAGTKIIAGSTVTIDNGKTVTIGGSNPASVHTNSANYSGSGGNGSTTGRFGGAGATTKSYGSRPSF